MDRGLLAARAGAVSYVLWGLLHLYAAWQSFVAGDGIADAFIVSKLQQNGWNIAFISLACIAIAVLMNWRNSRLGWIINGVMISITDIGFLVLIWWPGVVNDLLGPALWIAGLVLTTLGRRLSRPSGTPR